MADEMSKYDRVKSWTHRNQEKIFMVGVGVIVVGLLIVGVKAETAYQDRISAELDDAIDQLNALYRAKELV